LFSLRLRSLPPNSCKSIIQKVHQISSDCFGCSYFLVFFTLALLSFFTFHSRYSFLYRCCSVFSLSGLVPLSSNVLLRSTLFCLSSPHTGLFYLLCFWFFPWLLTPDASLTTTTSISLVFFSSCYLDVSVHMVSFSWGFPPWIFWVLLFSP